MMRARILGRGSDSGKGGFTLFGPMIALSIFSVTWCGQSVVKSLGPDSSRGVTEITGYERKLRIAVQAPQDELGQPKAENVIVTDASGTSASTTVQIRTRN